MSNHPHHAPRRRLLVAATSLALAALAPLADDRRMLIKLTDETVQKGVNTLPLFAGFAGLGILLLAVSAMWWREGR